jgi:DNA-binding transcriptional ArsR family regulator
VATTGAKRPGQRRKSIEEVIAYAVGHRTRVHILLLLNEGTHTAAQLAELIGEPLNNVSNHVRELLDAGSIELAETKRRRNALQHYYRAVETPFYSEDDVVAMTPQQRQVTAGLVIQSMTAEVMAALWAGKMSDDPGVCLTWDWLNLDAEGRRAVSEAQERHWEELTEIEAASLNRSSVSGAETVSYVVGQLGFERARKGSKPARSADGE